MSIDIGPQFLTEQYTMKCHRDSTVITFPPNKSMMWTTTTHYIIMALLLGFKAEFVLVKQLHVCLIQETNWLIFLFNP